MNVVQKYLLRIWARVLFLFGAGLWLGVLIGMTATPAKSEPQFYAAAGQGYASNGESGFVYGGGIDVALGKRVVIGVAYQQFEFPATPIELVTARL